MLIGEPLSIGIFVIVLLRLHSPSRPHSLRLGAKRSLRVAPNTKSLSIVPQPFSYDPELVNKNKIGTVILVKRIWKIFRHHVTGNGRKTYSDKQLRSFQFNSVCISLPLRVVDFATAPVCITSARPSGEDVSAMKFL